MLRLGKVAPGGGEYYLAPARGTGTGVEPAGRWCGRQAAALGLVGEVAREPFERVLAGEHPGSGRALGACLAARRVGGYDLTFAAPKSVSLLATLAGEEVGGVVLDCHRRAVRAALGYLEERVAAVRLVEDGSRRVLPAAGLLGAELLHRVSRAADPHLHSHLVLANLGQPAPGLPKGPDSRGPLWRSLDGRGFYAHRAASDALYHAELRAGLVRALGVTFHPAVRGRADLAGIDPAVLRCFSQRSQQIAEDLARVGPMGSRAVAALRTRAEKQLEVGVEELRPHWQLRAAAAGLPAGWLREVLGHRAGRSVAEPSPESAGELTARLAARAGRLLREQERPVAPRQAVAAVGWVLGELDPGQSGGAAAVRSAAGTLWERLAARGQVVGEPGPGVAEPRVQLEGPRREPGAARERTGLDWVGPQRALEAGADLGIG